MSIALRAVFFLSGCAALVFETLWFRQAGLMLGNSVWSSSIVLASFMAGLALGNLAAARLGRRLRFPVRTYAALEGLIGLSGLALVVLFPVLTRSLAPLLSALVSNAALLNGTRLGLAFTLMLLPACAMGATLPVLVAALGGGQARFGHVLGQLYGWNTLGAVAGALVGELVLIERFGLAGSGAVAASLNLAAALVALRLAPALPSVETPEPEAGAAPRPPLSGEARALLAAAALSGALLLALEVVWFRFMLLFAMGSTTTFAIMLAAVLVGIGLGGLLASAWLRHDAEAAQALPLVALVAATTTALTYSTFAPVQHTGRLAAWLPVAGPNAASALRLMLPTSLLSGLLFTLLGQALRGRLEGESRPAGLLTLANTLGAMLGALVGGLWLLPRLGIERSFLALAVSYAAVAALCAGASLSGASGRVRRLTLAGAGALGLTLALFPYGLMSGTTLPRLWSQWGATAVVAQREGLTETAAYLMGERWGQPVYYHLVTNNHSMSSTLPRAARYMRLFAYLPLALRPQSESALLISFGLGSTLDALTEAPGLRSIDVVDISRDILELGRAIYPVPRRYPLDDPRVRVHVEDGRFFLLTAGQQFDVITAEPPPPKHAGIVNLYSKEFFQLVRARLRPGGLASYWLPVQQLSVSDTRAITRGFCDAFEDCSLWTGFGTEWMLLGTHQGQPPDEQGFGALWREPRARESLEAIGFARPEQLGATFMADAAQLQPFLRGVRPLEDDFPLRLSAVLPNGGLSKAYWDLMDPAATRQRFADSAWVRRMWPPALREATLARFEHEAPLLTYMARPLTSASWVRTLAAAAGDPASRSPLLWMLRSSVPLERAARDAARRGVRDPQLEVTLAASDLVDGRFLAAEQRLHAVQRHTLGQWTVQWRVLALVLGGERERAARLMLEAGDWLQPEDLDDWRFLITTYGLPDPWGLTAPAGPTAAPAGS